MDEQNDDNVYVSLSVIRQIIDDLCEQNRRVVPNQCKCGSKKFTPDGDQFICLACGQTFVPDPELLKSPPNSTS